VGSRYLTGIRKTQKINCLLRLYEKKGLKCDVKEIQTLSTTQLKKQIKKLRGQKKIEKLNL